MFKFSIRDLLWVTLVIATVLVSWLDRRHLRNENLRLRQALSANERLIDQLYKAVNTVNARVGSNKAVLDGDDVKLINDPSRARQ